jgi:hypothetical protein
MATKKYKIGSLIKNEIEEEVNGQKVKRSWLSVGLGQKGKDPKWDLSVEIIVKDNNGKVVAKQTDGFLDVVDPRKEPEDLLAAGFIDEAQAEKMKQGLTKLSPKVRYLFKMRAS